MRICIMLISDNKRIFDLIFTFENIIKFLLRFFMNFFQKKEVFFCAFLLSLNLYSSIVNSAQTKFIFGRIQLPTKEEIKEELKLAKSRKIEKNVITAVAATTTIAIVYGLACIRNAAQQEKHFVLVKKIENNTDFFNESSKKDSFFDTYLIDFKSFIWDFSKFLADTGTMFTAGFISSCAYDFILKKIKKVSDPETISWYFEHQTNLKNILADLKRRAAYYDLSSALLSSEMYHLEKEVHLQLFIEDIGQGLLTPKNNGTLVGVDYYKGLLKALEKKYKKEFLSLQQLDEYILPILSAQKRNVLKSGKTDLFNRDNQARMDIAYLCDLFIKEFTKFLLFIKIQKNDQASKVIDLIETGNQFLDHMESMLNMTKDELNTLSKNNQGMFTIIYEFEKLLEGEISFLDTYYKV